ncbi:MAG TPA: hypothetical protein PKA27_08865, partial [Fimbriimonadaceae bacterium]|nr:hypothetical protein [Fimbriimonadaceae bacterium]
MVQVLSAFVLLVVFLLIVTEIGFRAGVRSKKSENDEVAEPEKVAATFVLSLLSLILAFTLSSAQSHHNARAEMILREAQSIRSARLALEDLPEGIRDEAMIQLNRYVKSKKSYNDILHRMESPEAEFQEGRRILHEIRRLCRAAIDPDKPESGRESLERIDHVAEVGLERHVLVIARHGDVVIRFLLVISTVACFLLG